ncbi:hypothetical protein ACFVXH_28995 [Kitasatospora sp. NPDC058184]|uniref:hypothetical protein n=1 Tax=Kitasatospora sp. NPDC058184 TaxID=3346370 RepID=UPI0036D8BC13
MNRVLDLPGAAHPVLASGVAYLDSEPAAVEATLEGSALQQRARFLDVERTIAPRLRLVRCFAEYTNEYPWQWTPLETEPFIDSLRSRRQGLAVSTGRRYQDALRLLCGYATDGRYGWLARYLDLFVRCRCCSMRRTDGWRRPGPADARALWPRCGTRSH